MTRGSHDQCMWLGMADGLVHLARLIVHHQTPGQQPVPAVLMTLDPANCVRASALSTIMPAVTPAMIPRQQRHGLSTMVSEDFSEEHSSSLQGSHAKSQHATEQGTMRAVQTPVSKASSPPNNTSAEQQDNTSGELATDKRSLPRKHRSESNTASSKQSPDSIPVFTGLSNLRAQAQVSVDSSPNRQWHQRYQSPRDQLSHVGKPALDILVASDRVLVRGGLNDKAVLREWTSNGHFVKSHILQLGKLLCLYACP